MKKIFLTVVAFCFGLFVSITIVACADEFTDNNNGDDSELQELKVAVSLLNARVAELEKGDQITSFEWHGFDGGWSSTTFNYDDEGRIVSVNYKNGEGSNSTDNIIYTETGCTFSEHTINGTGPGLNSAIIACYLF